ncbi:hypothetical protein LAG90_07960 [Marinilongibacter aquaticus]|uniref:Trm112 family protein n=1 Tax=Marinilongibacter aquaticus TaxID=2975157 RepID=UPI0021BD88CF|nr:Trm112 family protein [Marinilongibacter aquaticus]UBM60574.1 hypothetical protein LAG90_07960 [Marinilongibacter aquaticus]
MKQETIEKLCCPFDKEDLKLTVVLKNDEGSVIEGFFECTACRRIYPIVKGIPIMNPDEYREEQLELPLYKKWSKQLGERSLENFRLEERK